MSDEPADDRPLCRGCGNLLAGQREVSTGYCVNCDSEHGSRNVRLPRSWGALPAEAGYEAELNWVDVNRAFVIGRTTNGEPRYDWKFADTPPPSRRAISYMIDAGNGPREFAERVSKFRNRAADDASELVVGEKKSIAQVRQVLEKMLEGV